MNTSADDQIHDHLAKSMDEYLGSLDVSIEHSLAFYDKISILSLGIISVVVSALLAFKNNSVSTINQYKTLLIVGLLALGLAALCGLFYRLVWSKLYYHRAELIFFQRQKELTDHLPPDQFAKYGIEFFNIAKKSEKRFDKWLKIKNILEWLTPFFLICGLTLTTAYGLSQLFNFSFDDNLWIIQIWR